MDIVKPKALRLGETIGIVSPSWFGGPSFVRRLNRGIRADPDVADRLPGLAGQRQCWSGDHRSNRALSVVHRPGIQHGTLARFPAVLFVESV
jgi:hypothetical protein